MYLITQLPAELNDDILVIIDIDFELSMQWAIRFKRYWAASKIYTNLIKEDVNTYYKYFGGDLFGYDSDICDICESDFIKIIHYLDIDIKNIILYSASKHGYSTVVELLLADKRLNDISVFDYSITSASRHGHDKVVSLLLVFDYTF